MKKYLTENNLGEILDRLFPNNDFEHDKSVPGSSNKRTRPDYRSDSMKLILEFDGDSHYRSARRIKADIKKDSDYTGLGYRVYRIPYFVQITSKVLEDIFYRKIKFEQDYPNGFIATNVILPADFCELGIKRFKNDLKRFSFHKLEIVDSLYKKIEKLGDREIVIPSTLESLLL